MKGDLSMVVTRRESEVWRLIGNGESTKCVADSMGISVKTVENMRTSLYAKIMARNLADATRIGIERGGIPVRAGSLVFI
jgi:DNA-binding NarL/FixJ family response regulator